MTPCIMYNGIRKSPLLLNSTASWLHASFLVGSHRWQWGSPEYILRSTKDTPCPLEGQQGKKLILHVYYCPLGGFESLKHIGCQNLVNFSRCQIWICNYEILTKTEIDNRCFRKIRSHWTGPVRRQQISPLCTLHTFPAIQPAAFTLTFSVSILRVSMSMCVEWSVPCSDCLYTFPAIQPAAFTLTYSGSILRRSMSMRV